MVSKITGLWFQLTGNGNPSSLSQVCIGRPASSNPLAFLPFNKRKLWQSIQGWDHLIHHMAMITSWPFDTIIIIFIGFMKNIKNAANSNDAWVSYIELLENLNVLHSIQHQFHMNLHTFGQNVSSTSNYISITKIKYYYDSCWEFLIWKYTRQIQQLGGEH